MKTRYQWAVLPVCVLILALAGCHGSNQQGNNQQGAGQAPATSESSNAGNNAQQPANQAQAPAPTPAPEPATPREETITVPEGKTLRVRLTTPVSSSTAAAG